jgi:hypothetical protein
MAFLTVIIAMITGGFVSLYQRQAVAAGEDPYMKSMQALTTELDQIRTELQAIQEHLVDGQASPPAGGNPPRPSI